MKHQLILVILFFVCGAFYSKVIVQDNPSVSQEAVVCVRRTLVGWPEPVQRLFLSFGKYVITDMISPDVIAVSETTLWGITMQKLIVTCDVGVTAVSD